MRSLPFRTSTLKNNNTSIPDDSHQILPSQGLLSSVDSVPLPSIITPVESSDDDDKRVALNGTFSSKCRRSKKEDLPFLQIRIEEPSDADSDLEMTDSQPRSTILDSPWSSGLAPTSGLNPLCSPIPHRLVTESLNLSGGRTATPIYSHFTTNMNVDSMMQESPFEIAGNSGNATPSFRTDSEDWWRRRRLPSPISEDEISPTTTTWVPRLPDDNFAMNLSLGSASGTVAESHTVLRRNPPFQNDVNPTACSESLGDTNPGNSNRANTPPFANTPPADDSSTPKQNRKKLSIAMGYRADCDKCQRRVPGHYSHIIQS